MKFDKNRCLKLLKERQRLQNEVKLLRNSDKIKHDQVSNSLKFLNDELINLLDLLDDESCWRTRYHWLNLLKVFIDKQITIDEFFTQFSRLYSSNLNSAEMCRKNLEKQALGNFVKSNEIDCQVTPKCDGFSDIISSLHSLVDTCDTEITLDMNLEDPESMLYGMSEEMLRFLIEDIFIPKIEIYCRES